MSIDYNDHIEQAIHDLKYRIDEAHALMTMIWKAYPENAFEGDWDKLEWVLSEACDSLEVFRNYDGTYDRITRYCWGKYPKRYEVQCRLCDVQRECAEKSEAPDYPPGHAFGVGMRNS